MSQLYPVRAAGAGNGMLLPNSTQVPDIILDRWMASLSGAEFKVVMYVARRTYGFRREADDISIAQMAGGLLARDGRRLDHGTGLSRETVTKTIAALVEKGIILRTRHSDKRGGDLPSTYSLNLNSTFGMEMEEEGKKRTGVRKSDSPTKGGSGDGSGGDDHDKSDSPLSDFLTPSPPENLTPGESENPTHNKQCIDIQPDTQIDKQQQTEVPDTSDFPLPDQLGSAAVRFRNDVSGEQVKGFANEIAERVGCSKSDAISIIVAHGAEVVQRQLGLWHTRAKNPTNPGGLFRSACQHDWPAPAESKAKARAESEERRESRVVRAPLAVQVPAAPPSLPKSALSDADRADLDAVFAALSPCAQERLEIEVDSRIRAEKPSLAARLATFRAGGRVAGPCVPDEIERVRCEILTERAAAPITVAGRNYYDAADARAAKIDADFE